jgi:hypothetical protein
MASNMHSPGLDPIHNEEVEFFRYALFSKTLETAEEASVESRPINLPHVYDSSIIHFVDEALKQIRLDRLEFHN